MRLLVDFCGVKFSRNFGLCTRSRSKVASNMLSCPEVFSSIARLSDKNFIYRTCRPCMAKIAHGWSSENVGKQIMHETMRFSSSDKIPQVNNTITLSKWCSYYIFFFGVLVLSSPIKPIINIYYVWLILINFTEWLIWKAPNVQTHFLKQLISLLFEDNNTNSITL